MTKIPSAWKRTLIGLAGYTGGWWAPVVCTGRESHQPRILCHVYEHNVFGVAYTAPAPTVQQTRRRDAAGVPGHSRESIAFSCPSCPARYLLARPRWAERIEELRRVGQTWLDLST